MKEYLLKPEKAERISKKYLLKPGRAEKLFEYKKGTGVYFSDSKTIIYSGKSVPAVYEVVAIDNDTSYDIDYVAKNGIVYPLNAKDLAKIIEAYNFNIFPYDVVAARINKESKQELGFTFYINDDDNVKEREIFGNELLEGYGYARFYLYLEVFKVNKNYVVTNTDDGNIKDPSDFVVSDSLKDEFSDWFVSKMSSFDDLSDSDTIGELSGITLNIWTETFNNGKVIVFERGTNGQYIIYYKTESKPRAIHSSKYNDCYSVFTESIVKKLLKEKETQE